MYEYAKFIFKCNEHRKAISEEFFNRVNNDCNEKIIIKKE